MGELQGQGQGLLLPLGRSPGMGAAVKNQDPSGCHISGECQEPLGAAPGSVCYLPGTKPSDFLRPGMMYCDSLSALKAHFPLPHYFGSSYINCLLFLNNLLLLQLFWSFELSVVNDASY